MQPILVSDRKSKAGKAAKAMLLEAGLNAHGDGGGVGGDPFPFDGNPLLELYADAATVASSRGFFVDDNHCESLVPLADLFNHKCQVPTLSLPLSSSLFLFLSLFALTLLLSLSLSPPSLSVCPVLTRRGYSVYRPVQLSRVVAAVAAVGSSSSGSRSRRRRRRRGGGTRRPLLI